MNLNNNFMINNIGLHPLLREVALVDQDLFHQIESVFLFDFPLVDALMLFTKDNRTFVFGENHQEALGFKLQKKGSKVLTKLCKPRELEILRNKKILSVVYHRHVMVLTMDGQLYGWGRNEYGPLGLSKGRDFSIRPSLLMENVKKVDTFHHTIVLNDQSMVSCFGLNVDKQVNPNVDDDVQYFPVNFNQFQERVIDVCCSSKLSLVLTENNVLHLWGTIQGQFVNIAQSINHHLGKLKKMILLEYKHYDTWILTLNHERKLHLLHYDQELNQLLYNQVNTVRQPINIIASDHSSFIVVASHGYCVLHLNQEVSNRFEYQVISTGLFSIMDISRLYRIRFRNNSPCVLNDRDNYFEQIVQLRSFNSLTETDLTFGWDPSLKYPVIRVKKSILLKYNPSMIELLQGASQIIFDTKQSVVSFNYHGRRYPCYAVVYCYLLFVYTGKITIGRCHYDEMKVLADCFGDEKLISEINNFKQIPRYQQILQTRPAKQPKILRSKSFV